MPRPQRIRACNKVGMGLVVHACLALPSVTHNGQMPLASVDSTPDATATRRVVGDPRENPRCRNFYASVYNLTEPQHLRDFAVSEDATLKSQVILHEGHLFNPYGRLMYALHRSKPGRHAQAVRRVPVVWVEIPKCGSTTLKRMTGLTPEYGPLVRAEIRAMLARMDARGWPPIAFVISRDPLARALSAYGTLRDKLTLLCFKERHVQMPKGSIRHRLGCPTWVAEENVTHAFSAYVDFVTLGGLARQAGRGRDFTARYDLEVMHAFSQSFYLAIYKHPIYYVLRLEHLGEDFAAMQAHTGKLYAGRRVGVGAPISLDPRRAENVNQGGGRSARSVLDPRDLLRLATYYRQDYECMGYPWPPKI
mmetsp:Transcript_8098/g.23833  ORF Transcript_8098/g.23833 Transcript_8098/m.23833 type:complete len:364 (+) Transcript_8098:5-1096(+)